MSTPDEPKIQLTPEQTEDLADLHSLLPMMAKKGIRLFEVFQQPQFVLQLESDEYKVTFIVEKKSPIMISKQGPGGLSFN